MLPTSMVYTPAVETSMFWIRTVSPADAAVAVTRGALEKLKRDELQGVIAHEFSHILNGDMRINIRLMGALFGILLLALIGRRVLMPLFRSQVFAVALKSRTHIFSMPGTTDRTAAHALS